MSDAERRGGRRYRRGEVEFGRIVGFSDGILGIAMTQLVAGIAVPEVAKQDLGRALADNADDIVSFGLSFAVIGFLCSGTTASSGCSRTWTAASCGSISPISA